MGHFYYLLVIFACCRAIYAENCDRSGSFIDQKNSVKNAIEQTLQEINQNQDQIFRIDVLKNHSEFIPTIADWIYEDWISYDLSLSKETLIESFKRKLTDEQLPFSLVAIKKGKPVGVITLKAREAAELSDLEAGNLWCGSLHVLFNEQNQEIGESLSKATIQIARRLGYNELRFYLSESKGVDWCTKRGAEIIEVRSFRGHMITVLRYQLRNFFVDL